jgi:hypothetical protein
MKRRRESTVRRQPPRHDLTRSVQGQKIQRGNRFRQNILGLSTLFFLLRVFLFLLLLKIIFSPRA